MHTFSPILVNEARAGWSRIRWDQGLPQDSTGAFGLNGAFSYQQVTGSASCSDATFGDALYSVVKSCYVSS